LARRCLWHRIPFRRYFRHHSSRARPRLSDYRGIASFNAVLAPIASFTTWSWRHSIGRRHIHLGGGWIGQEIIHRQRRNIWRNWGTHCFWHWRDPDMDFSGSDLVFKSTPSHSPRRELASSILVAWRCWPGFVGEPRPGGSSTTGVPGTHRAWCSGQPGAPLVQVNYFRDVPIKSGNVATFAAMRRASRAIAASSTVPL
jgi:hypothetical protein